jgi:hypothetical protein
MGRKASNDTSPKKVIQSFCLDPDLLARVKERCKNDGIGLSELLQEFLAEWVETGQWTEKEK